VRTTSAARRYARTAKGLVSASSSSAAKSDSLSAISEFESSLGVILRFAERFDSVAPYSSGAEEIEQFTDLAVALGWVPHRHAAIEYIVVSSSFPLACDVTGFDEVRDDSLGRSLRDPHCLGDIA
jgi:hypothetical protein